MSPTLDPESLHKCPQPLVTAYVLGYLGSECLRNLSESTLNLYFNQRATCYCSSSFYPIFPFCSGWNIVSLVRINSRMFVLTLLKHTFYILQLLVMHHVSQVKTEGLGFRILLCASANHHAPFQEWSETNKDVDKSTKRPRSNKKTRGVYKFDFQAGDLAIYT